MRRRGFVAFTVRALGGAGGVPCGVAFTSEEFALSPAEFTAETT